jgi:uncharacterized protein YbjT (DUF2867 family)
MARKILVIGGSGMLGTPVVRRLHADGNHVRVISRRPAQTKASMPDGVEVVEGDVEQEASLERALEGCDGVHVNLMGGPLPEDFDRIEHQGTARVARVAAKLGIERLTYLSGAPAVPQNAHDPGSKAKLDAGKAIQDSGARFTIFRVTWMMDSLAMFVRGKRAIMIGPQPHPLRWIAADDYAGMVSRAYELPEAEGKTLFCVGPEPYNKVEALRIYCRIVHPEVKVSVLPIGLMRVVAALSFSPQLKADIRRMAFYNTIGDDFGDPTEAQRLVGKATTTLEAWCHLRAKEKQARK